MGIKMLIWIYEIIPFVRKINEMVVKKFETMIGVYKVHRKLL